MTIAGKINALVLVITVFLAVLATGFTAQREYHSRLDHVIEQSIALLAGLPDLQVDMYFRKTEKLDKTVARFLAPEAVSYAVLYDTNGEPLLRQSRSADGIPAQPDFFALRRGISATEPGRLVARGVDIGGNGGLVNALPSQRSEERRGGGE